MIYNPASGRKVDHKSTIHNCLFSFGIEYEIYETKGNLDCMNKIMNLDIDNYSAIVPVGGDGTFHEAINGLMRRKDGKKIPMGFLPNGSGDDLAGGLDMPIGDVNMGLEYIGKGDVIKLDVIKILIDHESEQELDDKIASNPSLKKEDYLRYSMINCSLCISANCARNAAPMKPYIGHHAYTIQTAIEIIKKREEKFNIFVDKESLA